MNAHLKSVAAHHDEEAQTYDAEYFARFALYHQVTLDNLRRFLPQTKEQPILDAGGGTGIWSVELAHLGYRVVLTDISQGMLTQAEKKITELGLVAQVTTTIADICQMPMFKDHQFSMVLCQGDPLSYCGNHHAAIKELVRVLVPGGTFIASVDNKAGALSWLRESEDLSTVQHLLRTGEVVTPGKDGALLYPIHAFTPEELRELWHSAGLTVERIIGKPVLAHRLACFRSEDANVQQRLLELELEHNADPALVPWGGHLEIAGRKQSG